MPSTGIGSRKYGMSLTQAAGSDNHELASVAVTTSGTHGGNPLLALVAIAAVTFGMAGVSVSARVGKFGAAAHAGK